MFDAPRTLLLVAAVAVCATGESCTTRSAPSDSTRSASRALPSWDVEIAPATEPGERLVLTGVVRDASGHPLPNAGVRIYHSDARGNYGAEDGSGPPHRLHAEFRSGPRGEFRIRTIVPGGAAGSEPPHLHAEISPRGRSREDIVLYLSLAGRSVAPGTRTGASEWRPDRGMIPDGFGTHAAIRDSTGVWRVHADLRMR